MTNIFELISGNDSDYVKINHIREWCNLYTHHKMLFAINPIFDKKTIADSLRENTTILFMLLEPQFFKQLRSRVTVFRMILDVMVFDIDYVHPDFGDTILTHLCYNSIFDNNDTLRTEAIIAVLNYHIRPNVNFISKDGMTMTLFVQNNRNIRQKYKNIIGELVATPQRIGPGHRRHSAPS